MSGAAGRERLPLTRAAAVTPAEVAAAVAAAAGVPPAAVARRETHMSWVFLTDREVFKLKKPVRAGSLDYTTLARREACARAEVALNRRLAPEVYLGVVPLMRDAAGGLRCGGGGEVVDWLVHMRRLAEARLLDVALAEGTATVAEVERVAARLARFFADLPAERPAAARHLGRFARDLALARRLLCRGSFDLAPQLPGAVLERLEAWLAGRADLLLARLAAGQVVEGHGDLRPDHVFLGPPVAVIDCLEFDRDLRLTDPAEEAAFLALECDRLGAPWAGAILREHCAAARGLAPEGELLAFYTAFHAVLRARLCLGHLTDPAPTEPAPWLAKARRYLAAAAAACRGLTLAHAR